MVAHLLKVHKPLISVNVPIHITLWTKKGTSKKYPLNFNRFRQLHIYEYGHLKEEWNRIVLPLVQHLPKLDKVEITYTLFTGSNQKSDLMNWISVVDKFFQDTLVKAGKLPDDNYDFVPLIHAIWGEVDKSNPRVQVEIKPYQN